jgi:hypothetical protein
MSGITDILNTVLESSQNGGVERLYEPIQPGDFFMSEYYCSLSRNMIPSFWLNEAVEFLEGGYNECVITGSLGAFKTTWANLILMYKIYDLFSYRDINTFLGLPSISDIYNIYFSVSLTQASLTGYKQFRNMVS